MQERTKADGVPVTRTTATIGEGIAAVGRGQLRYVTDVHGTLTGGSTRSTRPSSRGGGSRRSSSFSRITR